MKQDLFNEITENSSILLTKENHWKMKFRVQCCIKAGEVTACSISIPCRCQFYPQLHQFQTSSLLTHLGTMQQKAQVLEPLYPCRRPKRTKWKVDLRVGES